MKDVFNFVFHKELDEAFRSEKCERAFAVLPTIPSHKVAYVLLSNLIRHAITRREKTPSTQLLRFTFLLAFALSKRWRHGAFISAERGNWEHLEIFTETGFHSSVGISRRKCFSLSFRARSQEIFLVSIEKARKYFLYVLRLNRVKSDKKNHHR